jgi:hypothetical protein
MSENISMEGKSITVKASCFKSPAYDTEYKNNETFLWRKKEEEGRII